MKGKAALVVGMAAGYVLGTRDGRGRYEQIKTQADRLWNDPKVQKNVAQAQDVVKEKAPVVQAKVSDVAQKATGKVTGSDASTSSSSNVGGDIGGDVGGDLGGDIGGDLSVDPATVPPSTTPSVPPVSPATTTVPGDQKTAGGFNG